MLVPDYYAILEVSPNATLQQVKNAYRRLARLYHPDTSKQSKDTRIKQLNEAYTILSNPAKRAAYDALRSEEQRAAVIADAIRHSQEEVKRQQREKQEKMTWAEGAGSFVRELKKELQGDKKLEPKMTWTEGLGGFVREFKKGMRED